MTKLKIKRSLLSSKKISCEIRFKWEPAKDEVKAAKVTVGDIGKNILRELQVIDVT